jgi:hypothetical protein
MDLLNAKAGFNYVGMARAELIQQRFGEDNPQLVLVYALDLAEANEGLFILPLLPQASRLWIH